jgi:hypothetical protein
MASSDRELVVASQQFGIGALDPEGSGAETTLRGMLERE